MSRQPDPPSAPLDGPAPTRVRVRTAVIVVVVLLMVPGLVLLGLDPVVAASTATVAVTAAARCVRRFAANPLPARSAAIGAA